MVEYPIGELIAGRVRAMGVTPFYKMFKHDGVRGPNMATVYSDRGFGVRGPIVFYNRCNEAAAQLKPGDFDWETIFGAGVRWFHSGGIFASLSETTSELIIEGMQAAHKHGAVVSLDLNYREKLWAAAGGAAPRRRHARPHRRARRRARRQRRGPAEGARHRRPGSHRQGASALDHSAFFGMMERVVKRFPRIKVVATTLRHVHSTNRHSWSAVASINGQMHVAPTCELDVYDRVGGGDGFASAAFLRPADRRAAGRVREARLGARRDDHRLPRRHDDGDARAGARVRQGRVGEDSEVRHRQLPTSNPNSQGEPLASTG